MKNWLRKNGMAICSGCLALSLVFHIFDYSLFLFGEPEFPTED